MTLQVIKPYVGRFGFLVGLLVGLRVGRFVGRLDAWLSKEEKGKRRQTKEIPNRKQNEEEEEETWIYQTVYRHQHLFVCLYWLIDIKLVELNGTVLFFLKNLRRFVGRLDGSIVGFFVGDLVGERVGGT